MNTSFKLICEFFLLALLVIFFNFAEPGADMITIWICLSIFYFYMVTALASPTTFVADIPSFVTFRVCFLSFCFLLYFMPYQQYALGLDLLGSSFYVSETYRENSNLAIISSTVAVVAFCIGNRLGTGRIVTIVTRNRGWEFSRSMSYIATPFLGLLLAIYIGMGWRSAGEGAYTNTNTGGVLADGLVVIILMLCMLISARSAVLFAARHRLGFMTFLGLVMSTSWALRLLYFGDRNSFLLIVIAAAVPVSNYLLRFSRMKLLLGFMGLLVIYNFIEIFRTPALLDSSSFYQLFMLAFFEDSDRESSFNISAITLRATFDLVPEEHDYALGFYKLVGLLGVIPLFRGVIFGGGLQYDTTAAALTDFVLPPNAGWSVGTGIVSDFYLDLGIYGVAFGIMFMGWLGGLAERYVRRSPFSEKPILIYSLSLSLFAELPRYSADFPIRIIAWALVIIGLAKLIDATIHPSARPLDVGCK